MLCCGRPFSTRSDSGFRRLKEGDSSGPRKAEPGTDPLFDDLQSGVVQLSQAPDEVARVGGSKSLGVEGSGLHSPGLVGHFVGGATLAGGANDVAHERPVVVSWSDAEDQHGADFSHVPEISEPYFPAIHSAVSWFSPPSSAS